MNDIFNFKRFGKYFAADFKNCMSNYGLGMLLIVLISVISYIGLSILWYLAFEEWSGPEIFIRSFTFILAMSILMITMPAKCYGFITDKKRGTEWLMIPVSSFEKFLSMIIMTLIVIPTIVFGAYLGIDSLLCLIDKGCGISIIGKIHEIQEELKTIPYPHVERFARQILSPWLYIDDIMGVFLIFLLGATLFKRAKAVLTILSTSAVLTILGILSIIITVIFFSTCADLVEGFVFETIDNHFDQEFDTFIFRNVGLLDTLNDTIVNLFLMSMIYLRIKTIKH